MNFQEIFTKNDDGSNFIMTAKANIGLASTGSPLFESLADEFGREVQKYQLYALGRVEARRAGKSDMEAHAAAIKSLPR